MTVLALTMRTTIMKMIAKTTLDLKDENSEDEENGDNGDSSETGTERKMSRKMCVADGQYVST